MAIQVQFSHSVMSDSLRPHESQHTRPPCPSPIPEVHPNSCSIESVMPASHLILCRPLLFLPPIPPSIRVFSNESTLRTRWPKYWSFSFSISPSNEYSVQLSHPYVTTGKTIALTRQIFIGKVMSLLFNMLSWS